MVVDKEGGIRWIKICKKIKGKKDSPIGIYKLTYHEGASLRLVPGNCDAMNYLFFFWAGILAAPFDARFALFPFDLGFFVGSTFLPRTPFFSPL
jgi:hypothetical protein